MLALVRTLLLSAMLAVVMQPMVPKMLSGVPNGSVSLGASLRDRATLPSPLRGLGPSGGYPSRLRSRSLAARSACRGLVSGSTPCLAGAGCAAHRLRHYAVHDPQHRCLRSCARSCGASAHFAPHRDAHRCPHQCGHLRLRLRQRAAHDCLRLRPHRPPLTRRGGSDLPVSPASIPRTLMLPIRPFRPPGAALGLTPHASLMPAPPWRPLSYLFWDLRGHSTSCDCWSERMPQSIRNYPVEIPPEPARADALGIRLWHLPRPSCMP